MSAKSEQVAQELSEAHHWCERYKAALTVGLTEDEAVEFAKDGHMDQLIALVEAGCDARMIARIVA